MEKSEVLRIVRGYCNSLGKWGSEVWIVLLNLGFVFKEWWFFLIKVEEKGIGSLVLFVYLILWGALGVRVFGIDCNVEVYF